MQHFRAVDAVAEGDMFEGDVAADRRQRRRAALKVGSAGVFRISPSRATDSRAWWKSCQICARRKTGALTRPARILKATSSPTVRSPSMTSLAPKIKNGRGDELTDKLHALARRVAEPQHAKARRHVAGELLLPAALHLRLDRHGFERLDAGDALDQEMPGSRHRAEIFRRAALETAASRRQKCRYRTETSRAR